MDVRIIEQDRIILVGVGFYGDPFSDSAGWTEENEIGRLWHRFERLCQTHHDLLPPPSPEGVMYEVHTAGDEVGSEDVYADMERWISASGRRRGGSWMYNRYDERFKGIGKLADSEIDVGIPVE